MKKASFIAMILCTALLTFGCGSQSKSGSEDNSKTSISNLYSDYINLAMMNPQTLNPILNKDKSVGYINGIIYDSMFRLDKNYEAVPQLAQTFKFSEGNKTLYIKLNEKASWHDEKPVTSEDVRFTVDMIKKFTDSPYSPMVQNIASVDIISNKELNIKFNNSYAFSKEQLIFPIVPSHVLSKLSDQELMETTNIVGSGPYMLDKYEARKNLILKVNKNYYHQISSNTKPVKVALVFDDKDLVTMTMALESDITKLSLNDLSSFNDSAFKEESFQGRDFEYINFNFNNQYIQNEDFRKALSYGINKNKIIEDAYLKNANAVNFPLSSASKYYDHKVKPLEYDIKKAKEYLSKVKIVEGENQPQQTTTTYQLKAIVNKDSLERVKAAESAKDSLDNIGIKLDVVKLSEDEMQTALDNKEYDLAFIGWNLSNTGDPSPIIDYSGYNDDKYKSYMSSLLSSTNDETTKDIYSKIQKYTVDKVPFISIGITNSHMIMHNRIKGKLSVNEFDIYRGLQTLSIED